MTYAIYTSDAFVVKSRPSKDADLSVLIFTENYGLLYAIAKSARLLRSKQKYALQSLSYSSISLVKGREMWRITSVKKHISLYDKRIAPEFRTLFARMLLFIERFCPREQIEAEIFQLLKHVSGFIFKDIASDTQAVTYIKAIEIFFSINAFYVLGYVKKGPYIDKDDGVISSTNDKIEIDFDVTIDTHFDIKTSSDINIGTMVEYKDISWIVGRLLSVEILKILNDPEYQIFAEKIIEKAIRESHL